MTDILWGDLQIFTEDSHFNLDITYPYVPSQIDSVYYIFGYPRFETSSWGFVLTFPATLWGLIALTFLIIVMFFLASYNIYSNHLPTERFIQSGINANDIVFKVFGTLTEPDAIAFFTNYNAGNIIRIDSLQFFKGFFYQTLRTAHNSDSMKTFVSFPIFLNVSCEQNKTVH